MKYKTYSLLFIIIFVTCTASAKPRSLQQLKAIAARQLASMSGAKGMHAPQEMELTTLQALSDLTVIGNKQGGFVVLANDDAIDPVMGVSANAFSADPQSNPAFHWYLRAANAATAARTAAQETYLANVAPEAPFSSYVEPLIKTKWHQEAPFNNDVQKDPNGNPYLVGCVAIAMTQIMRYHSHPAVGTGSNSYTMNGETLSADFSSIPYQWDKMRETYTKGQYTDEEAKIVSELMRQAGIAVNMDYKQGRSSSYTQNAQNALITNFNYNPNLSRYTRDYYSEEEWMNMVFKELTARRPIYYSGADAKWENGHAFVIDGYQQDGKVHINWGWGGNDDGYYNIGILTPEHSDYSYYQDMIVGIQPEAEGQWTSHVVLAHDNELFIKKFSKSTISVADIKVWNVSSSTLTGKLSLVIEGNGELRDLVKIDYNADDNYWYSYSWQRITIPTDLPDGDYKIYLRFKDNRDADWQIVRAEYGKANSATVNIADGTFTVTGTQTDYGWVTAVKAPRTAAGQLLSVYDLQGRKVDPNNPDCLSRQGSHGIYIVRDRNGVRKVMR